MEAFAEVCTLLGGCSVFVGSLLIVSYLTIIYGVFLLHITYFLLVDLWKGSGGGGESSENE